MAVSRPISTAPNGELGLEFPYSGSLKGQSWYEQRWEIAQGLFESYTRYSLWIPSNFEHRFLSEITLDAGADISNWVADDIVGIGSPPTVKGIYKGTFTSSGISYIIVKYAQYHYYGSWAGTLTNVTRSESVNTTNRRWLINNNKFSAMWQGEYSIAEESAISEVSTRVEPRNTDPIGPQDIYFICKNTPATPPAANSLGTGDRKTDAISGSPAGIDPATDNGRINDFVIRRRNSSTLAAKDGITQLWKNGVKVYERLDMPMFIAGANYLDKGYILGYANSGFDEDTTFYVTKFELYGSPPPGIEL